MTALNAAVELLSSVDTRILLPQNCALARTGAAIETAQASASISSLVIARRCAPTAFIRSPLSGVEKSICKIVWGGGFPLLDRGKDGQDDFDHLLL